MHLERLRLLIELIATDQEHLPIVRYLGHREVAILVQTHRLGTAYRGAAYDSCACAHEHVCATAVDIEPESLPRVC